MIRFTSTSSAQISPTRNQPRRLSVTNEGPGRLYILEASVPATTTDYTVWLDANQYWEQPAGYFGPVQAIFAAAGTAMVSETTSMDRVP